MNDSTDLLLQLKEDLLQVVGNSSHVGNFFHKHPHGHIDDIICRFGIQIGKDLLYKACGNGHINVVRYIMGKGKRRGNRDKYKFFASIINPNNNQSIPVHLACEKGHLNIVRYLIGECGCDAEITNQCLNTPLHIACLFGHIDTVRYLVQRGCNLKAKNCDQSTPVHLACEKGHLNIVHYLIDECGCDPEIIDKFLHIYPTALSLFLWSQ